MSATRSLARGLALLELVAACPSGCSFVSLARRLELPNPTIARLLAALTGLGHLRRDPTDGLYRPGERLGWLGVQEDAELRLRRCAAGPLRTLAASCGLCGLLLRWTGRHAVCIECAAAPGLPTYQGIGHVTGDLLAAPWGLAVLPAATWRGQPAAARRHRLCELRRLAASGWLRCHAADRRRLTAPVRDRDGAIAGFLVLVGPPASIDPRAAQLGRELAATARRCTPQLRS